MGGVTEQIKQEKLLWKELLAQYNYVNVMAKITVLSIQVTISYTLYYGSTAFRRKVRITHTQVTNNNEVF